MSEDKAAQIAALNDLFRLNFFVPTFGPSPVSGLVVCTKCSPAHREDCASYPSTNLQHSSFPFNVLIPGHGLMESPTLVAALFGCPQQSWDSAGRAFRVNAQRFFRSRFPFRTFREPENLVTRAGYAPGCSIPMFRTTQTKELHRE